MGNITVQRPDLDRISAEGRVFAYHEAAATAEGGRVVRVFVSVIAPGEQIPPHSHPLGTETWVYILRGQVEHRYGAHLETSTKNTPGDLLHIEAGTPHQPVNLSDDEPVIALVACNYDQNDPANCRLHDPVRGAAVADDARRRPPQVDELGSELAARLVEGWSAFSKSPRFREFADFAHFLDASDEFQTVHRPRHPHPAHEFAAREMGIPFMAELRRRALHLDGWFPGRFDASSEEAWPEPFVDGKGEAHQVVARVFHSAVLRADGTEVCRLSVAFPHLHDGFGFPFPPRVSVAPSI